MWRLGGSKSNSMVVIREMEITIAKKKKKKRFLWRKDKSAQLHVHRMGLDSAGGDTSSGRTGALAEGESEGTRVEDISDTQHELANGKEEGKVKESNRGLSLSASIRRALGDGVVIKVILITTRMSLDSSSNCCSTGKSKDKIEKVNSSNGNRESKYLDEASCDTIKDTKHETKHRSKKTKVNLGIFMVGVGNK